MATLPQDVRGSLDALGSQLRDIETLLAGALATPLNAQQETLPPLEQAKLNVTLAYAINALFFGARARRAGDAWPAAAAAAAGVAAARAASGVDALLPALSVLTRTRAHAHANTRQCI